MTIGQVSAKIDLRLNKAASGDYDNIWAYHKQEAFSKAINEWVRRQIHGINQLKEGDEESAMRVDDLQVLLKEDNLAIRKKEGYVETEKLPSDYVYFKRLSPFASKDNCEKIQIQSYLREEANVDSLKGLPSFEFEETFHTIINNKIRIYHFDEFDIDKAILIYYRKPKSYNFKKLDEVIEFKDDVCELIVDETVKIISTDIESFNQKASAQERETLNN